ncbi:phage head closure protein [Endozoicomonas acroporae]|uniref:phage head closure protein n=1 Tax=Endozoicomonas acroporae TaxID=1701104 RepID=UPI0013D7863C|nr:phage head closure protein [Endozoicomonas acroporae]
MRAGRLRHRIHFQTKSQVRDKFNAEKEEWTDHLTLWSEIKSGSSKEFLAAQQVKSTLSHEVAIRYRAGISPDMRIRFGSRHFNIHGIRNVGEKNRQLVLTCEEFFGK